MMMVMTVMTTRTERYIQRDRSAILEKCLFQWTVFRCRPYCKEQVMEGTCAVRWWW